jgi:hypothetical protein
MAYTDKAWPIDWQVLIDGADVTSDIVDAHFRASLCNPGGQLDFTINAFIEQDIDPYETVVVYIDGVKVFTGYTQSNVKARRPTTQELICEDAHAKVKDTFITQMDWESQGESIDYWIGRFLDQCQVSYSIQGGGPPAPPKTYGFANCYQAIKGLLQFINWQMSVDADGVFHVKSHAANEGSAYEVEHTNYERVRDDKWLRNRAIVFGYDEESTIDVQWYVAELNDNGEIRTAIFASPDIYWPGTAYTIAGYMQLQFSTPLDVLTLECPGNPYIRIGETVHFSDPWEPHERYGLVTSCQWRISDHFGYQMTLSLDERCWAFWISDERPNILYCATEGAGVWKTYDDGVNWQDISGDDLNTGTPSYVKAIHVVKGVSVIGSDDTVWAATLGGIYKTETGSEPWTNITEEYMDAKAQYMDWWGVLCDPAYPEKVYCIGNRTIQASNDPGVGYIPSRGVIYMYISLDDGETWNSYLVNPYTREA